MPNKKQDMTATKGNMAAKKMGKPTSNISKANLILNPNKKVFKNIETNSKININPILEMKSPKMAASAMKDDYAAKMKSDYAAKKYDHAAKMSDTDMGIKERYGKQATSDVLAAQQKGNPIMPEVFKKNKNQYHTSGMPEFITSAESGETFNTTTGGIDEGQFTKITTKIPERSKVTATEDGDNYFKGEEFFVDPSKMQAQHPSKKRMENMVSKVATYNMPNVKAAQKKYYK